MRHRSHPHVALCFGLLVTLACGPSRDVAPAGDTPTAQAARSPVDTSIGDAAAPWYLRPDESCNFDTTVAHPDPDRLIAEYLRRDAAGQFLESSAWFTGATECPGQEPGPDAHVVIEGYRTAPLARSADTVRVVVSSTSVGLWGAFGLRADTALPPTLVDTVTAIRTRHGWRIASPALRQFVLRAAADSFHRAQGPSDAPDRGR